MPRSSQLSVIHISISLLVCLLCVAGCNTPLALKQMQAKNPLAKNAPKTPVKVVDAWNSYAQTVPDGAVMRGMAGRVHFYDNHREEQTVKVDGDLTVYVFDGNETDPTHTKPLKIFQFKANTLDKHYSYQQPIGHGYNFFLPFDEIGGEEQSLCLIVRFDNKLDENFIMTQPVNTILAGRKPERSVEPTIREFLDSQSLLAENNRNIIVGQDASVIQQVAHITETTVAVPALAPERSRVETIPLNSSMTRMLHGTMSPGTMSPGTSTMSPAAPPHGQPLHGTHGAVESGKPSTATPP